MAKTRKLLIRDASDRDRPCRGHLDVARRCTTRRGLGWFGEDGSREIAPILQKYGAHRFSRNVEEWVIRDFFQDRHDGVFLDVGANDYRNESNTYYLETELGWSGVAIDALEEFAPGYKEHRPHTRFFAGFVSDVGDSAVQFFVPEQNKLVASVSHEFTERAGYAGSTANRSHDDTGPGACAGGHLPSRFHVNGHRAL